VTKLEYHPDAADELTEAYEWYDAIDRVVGERFKRELERAEELVGQSPAARRAIFPRHARVPIP